MVRITDRPEMISVNNGRKITNHSNKQAYVRSINFKGNQNSCKIFVHKIDITNGGRLNTFVEHRNLKFKEA